MHQMLLLVTWTLFLVFAQLWAILDCEGFAEREAQIFAILLAGVAYSSANSFREEKDSGAFELLLVTPLRERQISWGRYWGVVGQFIPALLVVMLTGAIYIARPPLRTMYFDDPVFRGTRYVANFWTDLALLWAGVLGLPWLGLRLSLTRMSAVLSAVVSWVLWVPIAMGTGLMLAHYFADYGRGLGVMTGAILTIQLFIVLFAERGLTTILRERRFLRKGETRNF